MTNGVNDKKTVYSSEESSQSEENGSEPVPKLEKSFKLVLETESNSEKEINIEISSDETKDEHNIKEVNDSSDRNSKDCVSNNISQISNGIDFIKEESEEVTQQISNKCENNENNDNNRYLFGLTAIVSNN